MPTNDELKKRQCLPLADKIKWSLNRIEEFCDVFDEEVYASVSGKDSRSVMWHLIQTVSKNVPAVFVDTGMEFPEIRDSIKEIENAIFLKPKMPFTKVIEKYGFPLISKEQSQNIYEYRTTKSEKLKNIRWNGNRWGQGKISEKWKYLVNAPFKISHRCCDIMKKNPIKKYEKETGRKAMIGTMACESSLRTTSYLQHGCNAFDSARPKSMPLSIWTEKDIWKYIAKFKVPYAKVYDMGYERTGCMFCMFGVHLDSSDLFSKNRFQKLKETHPYQHNYCINKLKCGKVLDFINVSYS